MECCGVGSPRNGRTIDGTARGRSKVGKDWMEGVRAQRQSSQRRNEAVSKGERAAGRGMRLEWLALAPVYRAERLSSTLNSRGKQLKVYVKREAKALGLVMVGPWIWETRGAEGLYVWTSYIALSSWQRRPWPNGSWQESHQALIHTPRVIGQSRKGTQSPKPYTNAEEAPVFMRRDLQGGVWPYLKAPHPDSGCRRVSYCHGA